MPIKPAVIGLDISDTAIRLAVIERAGKKAILKSYNDKKLSAGEIVNGEIKDAKKAVAAIKDLVSGAKGSKIKTDRIVSVLPEPKTYVKVITVPQTDKDNMDETIRSEMVNHIPYSIEEVYYDWQLVHGGKQEKKIEVLIGVAPKKIVDDYTKLIEDANLIPLALEVEAAALTRGIFFQSQAEQTPSIVIDFGASRTGLFVYDESLVQLTISLPISGDAITKTIADTLKIDSTKAEEAKIVCGLDEKKCKGALRKVLHDNIELLAAKIKDAQDFYANNYDHAHAISQVILTGGGSNFLNIDNVLKEKLNINVKIAALKDNIVVPKALPEHKIQSFNTAIGLSLRGNA
ncbi:MAG: hypothetical protein COT81_00340 [Candidatus Buchananbacteria bacterium CG10_big_fil_rev_8_21_14_0_10_42_9]|uniref:SHS2 domain-containing protein n=1 Tax=Candidatus Buchananbacteria bacterium CG10_big_fil_rev_8_21_14_0_10_42_9 TaxID=1974526 RepID=A0A2H0W2R5_9BACT|nr:MAG: hypothetical protein COT81_00340 [Candidatus Buchananbacteria bacterium CG10_big_fil_rev_8_21_14_0_10_42_9]